MITNITIDGKIEKCLIFCNGNKEALKNIVTKDLALPDLVTFHSLIKTDENEELFIKVVPPKYGHNNKYGKDKKIKFFFRHILAEKIFLNAKAIKEYKYSKKLASIGINTPKVYAGGILLTNHYKYSGIVIYEKLDNLVTAQDILLNETCKNKKKTLLHNIMLDYKKMAKHKVHFRDFHMNNILVDPESMKLYWIDPALSKISYL